MPAYADVCQYLPRSPEHLCFELGSLNSLKTFNKMLKRQRRAHWPQQQHYHHRPYSPFAFEQENPGNTLLNIGHHELSQGFGSQPSSGLQHQHHHQLALEETKEALIKADGI